MMAKKEKCDSCKKSSGFDGCSRIECPKRKPITANNSYLVTGGMNAVNGIRLTSKRYLIED
jgi:hypothetical protein